MTSANRLKDEQLAYEVANRKPVDPADYELTVTNCGVNTVVIPKGAVDVPPGKGYDIQLNITNRSNKRQQYELRVALTSTDGTAHEDLARIDTNSLDPGETFTSVRQGHSAEPFWNGFTCNIEVWPSVVKIVDDIASGN